MSSVPKYLCLLALLSASNGLYAANPCLHGGSPLQHDGSGIGGTGHTQGNPGTSEGSGTGGTGLSPLQEGGSGTGGTGNAPWNESRDGRGTGGTGHETEIEGVITGFASICVNGLELHYQTATPIVINGRPATPGSLAVGQVIRAQTKGEGDRFAISRLQVRHLMVGPLQEIGATRAKVMGQTILFDEHAHIPLALKPGQKVAISGFASAGGLIIATRLDAVSAGSPDSITGEISQTTDGHLKIGNVPVERGDASFKPGENVRAEGRYDNGQFKADRVERDSPTNIADRFVIQGPVKESRRDGMIVGDRKLAVDPASSVKQELPRTGAWVRVEGQRRGQKLLIDKIEVQASILPAKRDTVERSRKNSTRAAREPNPSREDSGRTENQEHPEKPETTERENPEHPEQTEKQEAPERAERAEAPEKPEKVETPERAERVEAPEKPEKVEAPERVERVEAPEKPEKVEAPERVERVESRDKN